MAGLPKRVYHNLKEFEADAEKATKIAMDRTLQYFKDELKRFVKACVYDVYTPKWYERTNTLLEDSTLEYYIYKNVKNKIGGGIRFNPSYYNEHSERDKFQHGNDIKFLPFQSYLEIMNDFTKVNPNNPYNFPIVPRRPFYDIFKKFIEENFDEVFESYFNAAMGVKPKITAKGHNFKKYTPMNLSESTSQYKSIGTHNI
jgi:hypothetical protein